MVARETRVMANLASHKEVTDEVRVDVFGLVDENVLEF